MLRDLPQRNGRGEHGVAGLGEVSITAAQIIVGNLDDDEAAAPKRLEHGGEGGAIHAEGGGQGLDPNRLHAGNSSEHSKLSVAEVERAQRLVVTPRDDSGGALQGEAPARASDRGRGWMDRHVPI